MRKLLLELIEQNETLLILEENINKFKTGVIGWGDFEQQLNKRLEVKVNIARIENQIRLLKRVGI